MRYLGLFLLCLVTWTGAARAAETAWVTTDFSRLRLLAAQDAVGDGAPLLFGLQLQMNPGWKTYWRSPGDAGLPPTFDWQSESRNVAAVEFLFPAPHRFTLFGLDTFGYEGEVVFPLRVQAKDPTQPIRLAGRATYMICEEICIPFEATLQLDLPAGAAQPARQAYPIDKALRQVPSDGVEAGLKLAAVRLEGTPTQPLLKARAEAVQPFTALDLIVEGPAGYSFRQPQVTLSDAGRVADLTLPVILGPQVAQPLEGVPLTLTLVDGPQGVETTLVPATAFAAGSNEGLWRALLLALLGGLILNVMPCVLPVLSMKLLALVGQGGREQRAIRISFLFTTAGILASFLALALLVVALKAGGGAFGWGVQFQQPVFLAAMAAITAFFAASLFGFFSLRLPGALVDLGLRHSEHSHSGQFLTGFFAVLLATPCTAPFVTPAVGFALTHGTAEILAIFVALGLGLAAPYLAVAAFPGLAQRLPRPGPWIGRVKIVLGLALLGTAIWLLAVLLRQAGWTVTLVCAALLLALLLVLGLWRQRVALLVAVPLAVGAAAVPLFVPPQARQVDLAEGWVAFDAAAIAPQVAAGKVVFVDVTAAWCVTCLANKTLVLDSEAVAAALSAGDVVAMRADWTRPNEAIRTYLTAHDRFGIPFNVVYGPSAPNGIVLPEILSIEAVVDALAKAR